MKSWLIHTTTIINTTGDWMCSCHPYQQCCGPITKSDLTPTGTMESMPHTLFPVMHSPVPILQLVHVL